MMKLILVRHGRPEYQSARVASLYRFQELVLEYDKAGLSSVGKQDIIATAKNLPQAPIESSDLRRARETAEILATILEAPIHFNSLYREVKVSKLTIAHLEKWESSTSIWKILRLTSWLLGVGEFEEGPRQVWSRVMKAVQYLLVQFEQKETIILVSHGWFITLVALRLRLKRLVIKGPILPTVEFGAATPYLLRKPK